MGYTAVEYHELIHRAEVSNISDTGYLGIHRTLAYMVPLLQSPVVNPHATLITLFMNGVDENLTDLERFSGMIPGGATWMRTLRYLSLTNRQLEPNDPVIFKILAAQDCLANHDVVFSR